jgi:hypothetical protein
VILVLVLVTAVTAPACTLAAWIAYLRFCRFLVLHTNKSDSLKDAAEAAKAFRRSTPSALATAIPKLLLRSHR